MARGIPVVASLEHGGLGEILDEHAGWLMDHHDEDALATNVLVALGSEGLRRGKSARERVAETSDPNKIAETIELRLMGVRHGAAD